jgi:hypothetical protein
VLTAYVTGVLGAGRAAGKTATAVERERVYQDTSGEPVLN